jgi:hypothetical protein
MDAQQVGDCLEIAQVLLIIENVEAVAVGITLQHGTGGGHVEKNLLLIVPPHLRETEGNHEQCAVAQFAVNLGEEGPPAQGLTAIGGHQGRVGMGVETGPLPDVDQAPLGIGLIRLQGPAQFIENGVRVVLVGGAQGGYRGVPYGERIQLPRRTAYLEAPVEERELDVARKARADGEHRIPRIQRKIVAAYLRREIG